VVREAVALAAGRRAGDRDGALSVEMRGRGVTVQIVEDRCELRSSASALQPPTGRGGEIERERRVRT